MKRESKYLLVAVFLWCAGFLTAPVSAAAAGRDFPVSRVLYFFYRAVCHQFESHSLSIAGYPLAVCERCTAIYLSFLAGQFIMHFLPPAGRRRVSPALMLAFASLPMALDVAVSWLTPYTSTVVSRIITGACFGGGMALLLRQSLLDIMNTILSSSSLKFYGNTTR